MDRPRVVVTGVGAVAPNGVGTAEFSRALQAGRSGVGCIQSFNASAFESRVAGEVGAFGAEEFIGAKQLKRMERFVQMAVVAAGMALRESGLELPGPEDPKAEGFGVVLGTGMGSLERTTVECNKLVGEPPYRFSPMFLASSIPNIAAAQVALQYGLTGYLGTTLTACAAGLQAIGEAYWLLQRGEAKVMLAGGSEANITPLFLGSFGAIGALSRANQNPSAASRPFDRDRDGFVIAEGAGVVVLELLEDARARGAQIYGEVLGFGCTADAYHVTAPHPEASGMRRAMQAALAAARLKADQLAYINAHGSSTPLNDTLETKAIKLCCGPAAYRIPVSSTKSMTGHTLAAAGALELIACLIAMRDGFLPPTMNYTTPDPDCDLDYIPNEARPAHVSYAMTNSFGFGGQNASVVLGRI